MCSEQCQSLRDTTYILTLLISKKRIQPNTFYTSKKFIYKHVLETVRLGGDFFHFPSSWSCQLKMTGSCTFRYYVNSIIWYFCSFNLDKDIFGYFFLLQLCFMKHARKYNCGSFFIFMLPSPKFLWKVIILLSMIIKWKGIILLSTWKGLKVFKYAFILPHLNLKKNCGCSF